MCQCSRGGELTNVLNEVLFSLYLKLDQIMSSLHYTTDIDTDFLWIGRNTNTDIDTKLQTLLILGSSQKRKRKKRVGSSCVNICHK